MNIVIFSGGTGSVALQVGLKKLYPECKITNIINAYDDGKSTGIVRKICNVLGPSDVRKNQFLKYKLTTKHINKNYLEFFEDRFDFPSDTPVQFCLEKLSDWNLNEFTKYIIEFFKLARKRGINEFKDFNISNIIYAVMFMHHGINETIEYFEEFLNIDDKVVLNSLKNLCLSANTESGKFLPNEASIVDYNNRDNRIKEINFSRYLGDYSVNSPQASSDALRVIKDADMIIFSPGTQWASLIPTYMTKGIKEQIKENENAIKLFICNTKEDSDMLGMTNSMIVELIHKKFIDLHDFKIIVNKDASDGMNYISSDLPLQLYYYSLGNYNGKHNPLKLGYICLQQYFNIHPNNNILFIDFDDTIFSRDPFDKELSYNNCFILNKIAKKFKVVLISGNSYSHIHQNLSPIFGGRLQHAKFDIWADGGILKYVENQLDESIDLNYVKQNYVVDQYNLILDILHEWGIYDYVDVRGFNEIITCITIKGLPEKLKNKILIRLNKMFDNNIAFLNGRSSIDIINKSTSKAKVLKYYPKYHCPIYVGDECKDGNDSEISKNVLTYFNVKNVSETSAFLQILNDFVDNWI